MYERCNNCKKKYSNNELYIRDDNGRLKIKLKTPCCNSNSTLVIENEKEYNAFKILTT